MGPQTIFDHFLPKPETTKVFRWGEKNPVLHIPSQASTPQDVVELAKREADAAWKIDYSKLQSRVPMTADLLDPPGGEYPFFEYSDFDADQRGILLGCRVAWALSRMKKGTLTLNASDALSRHIADLGAAEDENGWEATVRAAALLKAAVKASEEEREVLRKASSGPQPARPGHLMAEGRALAVAKGAIKEGNYYSRKVTFSEPVNAFTMLHGDNLARGGDMLTAVTITDTEEFTVATYGGRRETRYTAKAVNI